MSEATKNTKEQISVRGLMRRARRYLSRGEVKKIEHAYHFAAYAHRHQKRLSGEPYIIHPLEIACDLADFEQDAATLTAALLHDVVEDTEVTSAEIEEKFSPEVAHLVEGVTKISKLKGRSREANVAENVRKMLLATISDSRVIIIKLFDKWHNMRTLGFQPPEKQARIARETLDIYAPLAGRLGIYQVKSRLEDLAFQILNPEAYAMVKNLVVERREEREEYLKNVIGIIEEQLKKAHIKARVFGRVKHFWSIYQKMDKSQKNFEQIYDLRAVRIITQKETDCYTILGLIHSLWKPIPGRFKDYIAMPKVNLYQSLHTSVLALDAKPLELQIRTDFMHQIAEKGIAAHWNYKERRGFLKKTVSEPANITWLKNIKEDREVLDNEPLEFMEQLRQDLFNDDLYVFTPQGKIIHLPAGATVLDFAFRIHTDVGLQCSGAKVNGKVAPIRSKLQSGDQVEIITRKNTVPSPTWLKIVKTAQARAKIRGYLKKKDEEDQRRFALKTPRGISELKGLASPELISRSQAKEKSTQERKNQKGSGALTAIEVAGLENVKLELASCCSPIFGEPIIGYVAPSKGVIIHRADCGHVRELDQDKWIHARWQGLEQNFSVVLQVEARDVQGVYLKMVEAISRTQINMTEASARRSGDTIIARFTMDISHTDLLKEVIGMLRSVEDVFEVKRVV